MRIAGGDEAVGRNFPKVFGLRFLGDFLPIAPVLILFYTANGLNSTQIFTVQALFHLAVLSLEVPSGYLADVIGRKKTLTAGALFFPLGFAVYAAGRSFAAFVLAELLLAVSVSMRSGCDSALLFDSLKQLGREGEYKRMEGRAALLARAGTAASALAGGWLATAFLRLPFIVNIGTALVAPALAMSLEEPRREARRSATPALDILRICRHCLREARIRPLVLLSGLIMAAHVTALWAYFLLYRDLGIAVSWFGVLFAIYQLAGAAGSGLAHAASRRFGGRAVLAAALLSAPILILLGLLPRVWLLPLVPVNAFLWNLAYPVLLERLNLAVASDVRATVLSLASMAGSVMFIVLAPLFGFIVDAASLAAAFAGLGALFLAGGAALTGAIARRWPEGKEPA